MRFTVVACMVLTTISIAVAQQERFVVRTFGVKDGLPPGRATSVYLDAEDRIWTGTPHGVFISIGEGFSSVARNSPVLSYDLEDAVITFAPGGSDLAFLVAGENGLARALYRSQLSVQLESEPVFPDVPPDSLEFISFTSALLTSQREVLFGTNGHGVWVRSSNYMTRIAYSNASRPNFRFTSLYRILPGRIVTGLIERRAGDVWVGTTSGLVRFRVGEWTAPLKGSSELSEVSISTMHEDKSGTMWVGTTGGALYAINGDVTRRVSLPERWRGRAIRGIASTARGDLWLASTESGLLRIRDGRSRSFSRVDGLPSEMIHSIHVDMSDHLWVCSDGGLSVISPESWFAYGAEAGLPEGGFTSAYVSPAGDLIFGGKGAVVRMRNGRTDVVRLTRANAQKQIHGIIADPDGSLWMMMQDGVVHFKKGFVRAYPFDRTWDPSVLQIAAHPSGGVLVRNPRSIVHLSERDRDTLFVVEPGERMDAMTVARNGDVFGIYRDQPGIVYRIREGRIERASIRYPFEFLEDASGTMFLVERMNGFMRADDIPWTTASSLVEADWSNYPRYAAGLIARSGDRFLFTSAYSLIVTDPSIIEPGTTDSVFLAGGDLGVPLFELSNGSILCFGSDGFQLFDARRRLLVMHDVLNRVALAGMQEERAFRSQGAGAWSLLKGRRQIVEDAAGNLWFAHANGIGMIRRPTRRTEMTTPLITLVRSGDDWYTPANYSYTGIAYAVNRRSYEVQHRPIVSFDSTTTVRILPRTDELVFSVSAPVGLKDGSVEVQYTLDPGKPTWTPATPDGEVRLIGLGAGSYRLKVRSVSANATTSPERTLHFTLELPFWNSTWFFVLAGVTGLYGVFTAYERRMASLRLRHNRETEEAIQQNELRMARTLQMGMLPKECPTLTGFDIAARMVPASEVGGDFYDFMSESDETRIVIGDVSGHGLTGAMVVGMARTAVRFASTAATRIAKVLSIANDRLREDISKNVFIAVTYGVLQPRKRRLRYVCAGQPTPILVRNGVAQFLPRAGGDRFPLGMLTGVRYREESVTFHAGDLLLLYTDGVVEAMNSHKQEFGFDRLQRALTHLQHASAEAVIDGLLASVEAFTDKARQGDDITLIVIKSTAGGVS